MDELFRWLVLFLAAISVVGVLVKLNKKSK